MAGWIVIWSMRGYGGAVSVACLIVPIFLMAVCLFFFQYWGIWLCFERLIPLHGRLIPTLSGICPSCGGLC